MKKDIDITINLHAQTLHWQSGAAQKTYAVSTAAKGAGEMRDSYRTPRGLHVVRAKIGGDAPVNAVFRGRRWTGEIYTPQLAADCPRRDWILTRILWLSGCEWGKNRGGQVDTMRRYIYIHGAPDGVQMGVPGSIGCIRMHNADVVEIFARTPAGARVRIIEN